MNYSSVGALLFLKYSSKNRWNLRQEQVNAQLFNSYTITLVCQFLLHAAMQMIFKLFLPVIRNNNNNNNDDNKYDL